MIRKRYPIRSTKESSNLKSKKIKVQTKLEEEIVKYVKTIKKGI